MARRVSVPVAIRAMRDTDPVQLKEAFADLAKGVAEIPGPDNHPSIMAAFEVSGHDGVRAPRVKSELTAWCAAKANQWHRAAEFPIPPVKINLTAQSYEMWGRSVPLEQAQRGDACVFYREGPSSWKRHIGLYLGHSKSYVFVIGGNQTNAVTVIAMPRTDLVPNGVRRGVRATVPALREAGSTTIKEADQMENAGTALVLGGGAAQALNTVTTSTPDPAAVNATTEALRVGAENIGLWQTILQGVSAIGALMASPWFWLMILAGVILVYFARRNKKLRVKLHALGIPIRAEAEGTPEPVPVQHDDIQMPEDDPELEGALA